MPADRYPAQRLPIGPSVPFPRQCATVPATRYIKAWPAGRRRIKLNSYVSRADAD